MTTARERVALLALLVLAACGESAAEGDAGVVRRDAALDASSISIDGAIHDGGAEARDAARDDASAATCGAPMLCEGFESEMPELIAPNCGDTDGAALDDTIARSGARSLRIEGGGSYCDHLFARFAFPETGALHARFYVRLSAALGAGHTTFAAMHELHDQRDLRLGGQNQVVVWNRELDDATLPELSPTGTASSRALAPETWHCIELALDETGGTLRTRIDGAEVAGLVTDGAPTPDLDAQWLRRAFAPRVNDLRLGWESYAGQAMTIWIDDVAIGAAPIGCLP